jgi:hypothetical protein
VKSTEKKQAGNVFPSNLQKQEFIQRQYKQKSKTGFKSDAQCTDLNEDE